MASVTLLRAVMEAIDPDMVALHKKKERTEEEQKLLDQAIEEAEEVIDIVEEHYAKTKRILVVGQIQHKGSEKVHTVALGPYGARGVLSDEEKFAKAAEASTAAHEAGGKLAWDTTTKVGNGRYMVVPLFRTPRDAWDFYRTDIPGPDLIEYVQHGDAESVVPACVCGMKHKPKCYRHLEK